LKSHLKSLRNYDVLSYALLFSTGVVLILVTQLDVSADQQIMLEYNASGTFVKVPELNEINIPHVSIITYFVGKELIAVNITPLTPSECMYNLSIHYPNGTLITTVYGSVEPFKTYSTAVGIELEGFDYVVIEGSVCNLTIPPYAVRYYPTYITPPSDPIIQLFWSIATYSPIIAIFLRSSPRVGGITMMATLPIIIPIMYALGVDPTVIPIFTSFIVIISLLMITIK